MSSIKANKYIDFNQFPKDEKGRISWKNSVGITVEFFYYNEKHILKILEHGNPNTNHIKVKVDDMQPEIIDIQKLKHLYFDYLFYKPNYFYNVGDVINNVVILEQLYIESEHKSKHGKTKHYKCKCLKDGYEYIVSESDFKKSNGCPVCAGKRVFVGYNDLATTNPEIIKFLSDKEDGYKYTKGSHKSILVECTCCGYKKYMKVEELVYNGGLLCPKCSDGLSYPNKFAYNVFEQLYEQYASYDSEYSPDWAGRMRYDNHIVLKDGRELIVEMDGGFHYNEYGKWVAQNDVIKDSLAEEHGIKVIRVNCFYNQITNRFKLIKDNFINELKQYFDLSCVDWKLADSVGVSNRLIEVVNYYNEHPFTPIEQIAKHFHLSYCTIRNYLVTGGEIGLCKYIKNDLINRSKTSIPLMLCKENGDYIGVYMSARQMANEFKNENFVSGTISQYARLGRPYKGYIIKRIAWDEYEVLQNAL